MFHITRYFRYLDFTEEENLQLIKDVKFEQTTISEVITGDHVLIKCRSINDGPKEFSVIFTAIGLLDHSAPVESLEFLCELGQVIKNIKLDTIVYRRLSREEIQNKLILKKFKSMENRINIIEDALSSMEFHMKIINDKELLLSSSYPCLS